MKDLLDDIDRWRRNGKRGRNDMIVSARSSRSPQDIPGDVEVGMKQAEIFAD